METGDTPTFMIVGRVILGLMYDEEKLDSVCGGVSSRFVGAFRDKLDRCLNDDSLLLEWGVAAILDPR